MKKPKPIHLLALCLITVAATLPGYSEPDDGDSTQTLLENILSKDGISIGGEFRSQMLNASIDGPTAVSERLRHQAPSHESVEYTSVDFDIKARPNTSTQGRLIFRMHQDWRNFFSDLANPIFTRWISMDGSFLKMIRYNVGDYKENYSPLTLHAPEVGFLYEPHLFERRRKEAMDEEFLGDNQRLLQGVNLNFDAEIAPIFQEAHLNLMGSRLRNVETDLENGNFVTMNFEASPVEKYLAGENFDFRFLKGITAGNSAMLIFDKKATYAGDGEADTAAQRTSILAFRGGVEAHRFLEDTPWKMKVFGEVALSSDDTSSIDTITNGGTLDTVKSSLSPIDDKALYAGIKGGYTLENLLDVSLSAMYLNNGNDFRNELAQSPTFVGEPIMNVDNDSTSPNTRTHDINSMTYSTMDAMYHHVFKFVPSQRTNNWWKAPFRKNAYTNSIYTQSELSRLRNKMDPALQLVMPFGPATPNRQGLRFNLKADVMENKGEVTLLYSQLEEGKGLVNEVALDSGFAGLAVDTSFTVLYAKSRFTEAGGGGALHLHNVFGLKYPLTLSGSFVRSAADNDGPAAADTNTHAAVGSLSGVSITNDAVNLGFYYKFWKRTALLGGFQQIKTTTNLTTDGNILRTQRNYAGALEYKIASGAYALFSLGQITVEEILPDESARVDFDQLLAHLSLKVRF